MSHQLLREEPPIQTEEVKQTISDIKRILHQNLEAVESINDNNDENKERETRDAAQRVLDKEKAEIASINRQAIIVLLLGAFFAAVSVCLNVIIAATTDYHVPLSAAAAAATTLGKSVDVVQAILKSRFEQRDSSFQERYTAWFKRFFAPDEEQ